MKNLIVLIFFLMMPLFNTAVHAAQLIPLNHLSFSQLRQHFTFSTSQDDMAAQQLKHLYTHQSRNHLYHIHLQQYFHHIPIYGGMTIIHSPRNFTFLLRYPNTSVQMTGKLYQNLPTQLGSPPPHFDSQNHDVLISLKSRYAANSIQKETSLPIIYMDKDHSPHWAYKISLFIQPQHQPPEEPTQIIDAFSGQPYLSWNNLKTTKHDVSGLGYGGNPQTGLHHYGQDDPALSIRRDDEISRCFLENKQVKVINMNQRYIHLTRTQTFPCSKPDHTLPDHYWTGLLANGYDRINEAYSPSNDALYFAYLVKKLYNDWYHIDPLYRSSGNPQRLIMRVHFGEKYPNAFWDGESMTFGDGDDRMFYPLVSLSVTAHEISHGFTHQHANLEYVGQSGAINEAFSDMAAISAENYANYPINWHLGHEILKPQSGLRALRYMDKPSEDGKSFESIPDYLEAESHAEQENEGINVHYGSGVFNRLFYLIATSPGWSIHQAFDTMVYANMDYWTPYSDFQDAGCGVLHATRDLGYELSAVRLALEQIGVAWTHC